MALESVTSLSSTVGKTPWFWHRRELPLSVCPALWAAVPALFYRAHSLYLMIPALVTIFLFQFVAIWNNYFLPLVMLSETHVSKGINR
jgi:hypothetical protein